MSIRITELDAITSLQDGDYVAIDNESNGTHKFKVLDISSNVANNIANNYSSSASYAIGQYCLYNNNLYRCTTTISTPEAWNASHWVQVTVGEGLYDKVDKINGKELSTNDFTNAYKTKLDGIEDGAEVNVQANWTENDSSRDDYIKNKPENATTSTSGFMSASDKQKLDGIEAGAEVNVQPNWAENDSSKDDYIKNKPTIDTALSTSSDNAVRNSAITAGINAVQNNLNAEITARENAVSAEQTARENADNALDGRIDTIEEILPNKANINGSYEEMTVGSAEQLISTESIEDSEPYIFRKSGNGADIGDRETDMLVGGSVVWNQLWDESKIPSDSAIKNVDTYTTNGVTLTKNGDGTISIQTDANGATELAEIKIGDVSTLPAVKDHTCYISAFSNGSAGTYYLEYASHAIGTAEVRSASNSGFNMWIGVKKGTVITTPVKATVQIIDLTAMFGTEIADYIYGLEQAEAGKGVAWFRHYFPKPYYAYNAGSLQSVNVASHDLTGFNQWDEEWELGQFDNSTGQPISASNCIRSKNFISVLPSTEYYTTYGSGNMQVFFYKADESYISQAWVTATNLITTPSDCYKMKFRNASSYGTTYKGDICINLSWSGYRNGEYEEYVKHSYPYDESVELRGIPQLVDGELKYDGDTYESSGKVTRKYGIVDLGTLDWSNGAVMKMFFTTGIRNYVRKPSSDSDTPDWIICNKFTPISYNALQISTVKRICISAAGSVGIVDGNEYSTLADFKTAMSGVYLVYELATPTEEEAEGFTNPQIVNASGTEEYVDAGVKNDTRDVAIPVGHITQYVVNLRDKLQHLPFLAKEDGDYFVNQTGTQMKLKKVEGYYEDLVVGVADNLSTDIRTNDQTPYLFRTSGGSVDIGDREYINSVVGGTIVWNQLVYGVVQMSETYGITRTKVNDYTVRVSGTSTNSTSFTLTQGFPEIKDHIYFYSVGDVALPSGAHITQQLYGRDKQTEGLGKAPSSGTTRTIGLTIASGTTIDVELTPMVFDLTQMFGSTIADYIYSLEQTTTGAGVAYFRKLFPKSYYESNAGELLSVSGLTAHEMCGFNQWDEEWEIGAYNTVTGAKSSDSTRIRSKNYIPVVPSTLYSVTMMNNAEKYYYILFYDADKNYISSVDKYKNKTFTTPSNCYYITFYVINQTTYSNDICINLSWDGSRDGEYEPYQKWSYPLDSSLELRGVPKLDSNNNLYYDGDTYESDGMVTRRYGVVDLGTLTFSYDSSGKRWQALLSGIKSYGTRSANLVSDKWVADTTATTGDIGKIFTVGGAVYLYTTDSATSPSGTLVYELATPTTETAEPYTSPQIVNDFGTEEYVIDSTIDVPIPVGHDTDYPINLKSKLEMAPDSPDGDGDYIVRQTNGTNEYVPLIIEDQLPAVPSTDGTYTLTVTIADGEATYSWT